MLIQLKVSVMPHLMWPQLNPTIWWCENTGGYSNSSKTRQIGSLRVPANYYTWCILWLMHLTQHEVALISAISVCVCMWWGGVHWWLMGGTHLNGSKNNKHLGLWFLKPLYQLAIFIIQRAFYTLFKELCGTGQKWETMSNNKHNTLQASFEEVLGKGNEHGFRVPSLIFQLWG